MLTNYIIELTQFQYEYFNKWEHDTMTYEQSLNIAIEKVENTILDRGYILLEGNKQYNMNDLELSKKELNKLQVFS